MPRARVLAVDDQRYFRELIGGVLSERGYEVVTASSGEEALHVLARADFDVVVTDLVMPGMDGVELVRRVKEHKPDQEVVMVTGVSDVNSAIEAMKQGATDYILKPLDGDLLTSSLDQILQRRRIADEHARLMTENQEYLGALALYERAAALFSTLVMQPLGERFIEALCLETGAQGGVLWAVPELGGTRLELVAARGIIRVEEEPREILVSQLGPELEPLSKGGGPQIAPFRANAQSEDAGDALFVPLRRGGDLIGLARLSDKLEAEDFSDSDKAVAQAFTRFGALAVGNALQFREQERRSLFDPGTGAYTHTYFEDVVRNEIQKAHRFGRPFSIVRVHLGDPWAMREELGDAAVESWRESIVQHVSRVLRSTDLVCAGNDGHFNVLLAESDAEATETLTQRMRDALHDAGSLATVGGKAAPQIAVAPVTYPVDGTQLESLRRTLEDRIARQRSAGVGPAGPDGSTLAETIESLVSRAEVVPAQLPIQVLDFLIDEATRRPDDPGLLFVAPGSAMRASLAAKLEAFGAEPTRTRIVVATSTDDREGKGGPVIWIPDEGLGTDRLCFLYWGERPAYALVAGDATSSGESTVFHTADRAVVERLATQVQRDLAGVPDLDGVGGAP